MDVVYKGGALLAAQVAGVAHMAAALPRCLLVAASGAAVAEQQQQHPGAVWFEGKVLHSRRRPVENSFEYPVRMVLVDLQQPPPWFLQHQAHDHLNLQEARAAAGTQGRVLLLTNPVVAGYTQNPISVYYCYEADGGDGGQGGGGRLATCIAEVTNTPWGERVSFCFDPAGDSRPKVLHVSPFMDMDNTWLLQASDPQQGQQQHGQQQQQDADKDTARRSSVRLSVLVDHPALGRYFDAHLLLARCPPQRQGPAEAGGLGALWRFGFMPQRVALWIYWQALRLAAKGCPLHPKPQQQAYAARAEAAAAAAAAAGKAPPTSAAAVAAAGGTMTGFVWRAAQAWPWFL